MAALLLTTRPVCITGADHLGTAVRLQFIDSVMSLLPYGMRSSMSASTWASSTALDLKLRLFFSSSHGRGAPGSVVVDWNQPAAANVGDDGPYRYLRWLRETGSQAREILARQATPATFQTGDISMVLSRLPLPPSSVRHLDFPEPVGLVTAAAARPPQSGATGLAAPLAAAVRRIFRR